MIRPFALRTVAACSAVASLTLVLGAPIARASTTASLSASALTTSPTARPFPYAAAFSSYLLSRPGAYSVAVHVRGQGSPYLFTKSLPTNVTASIVKVDILATLLRQVQLAGRSLSAWEHSQTVAMIEQSDNSATTALWNHVGGGPAVAAFNAKVGMSGTVMGSGGYWGLTSTTAADQVALLDAVTSAVGPLNATSRAYALSLMHHVVSWQAWGVTAGPPAGSVAVKNGWLPRADGWHVNSVGSVNSGSTQYTIAVLSASPTASEAQLIQTIAGLSRLVWQHQIVPTSAFPYGYITHLLQQGSADSTQVAVLQRRLHGLGVWPGAADGVFAARLTGAVKQYQSARRLTPDGVVGPLTGSALGIWR